MAKTISINNINPMRVLIAEDDRVLSQSIATRLNKAGVPTVVAFDAMQAVMLAMRTPLAAVILDVNMPGGTGLEVLKRLKTSIKTNHVPILVLTGSSDANMETVARGLGAEAFLTKPADFDALEAFIGQLLGAEKSD